MERRISAASRLASRRGRQSPAALRLVGLALALTLLLAASAHACTGVEYTGAAGGSWETKANWNGAEVPKSTQTACIPAGKGSITVPAKFKAEAQRVISESAITIANEGTLAITGTEDLEPNASAIAGLTLNGHLTSAGSWINLTGAVIISGEVSTSHPVNNVMQLKGGTLTGSGAINMVFDNIAGTLQPGGPKAIGALHFGEGISQQETGTLEIDLKSPAEFDRIEAPVGTDSFRGTLEVNLLGGYAPAVGTEWRFLPKSSSKLIEFSTDTPEGFAGVSNEGNEGASIISLPVPPTIVDLAASAVTDTSAELHAEVNPNNEGVEHCEFQWGTSTSYGSSTGCSAIPFSGNGFTPATGGLVGLTANTTYHYRMVAKNKTGPAFGEDVTFTTSPSAGPGGGAKTTGGGETPPANTSIALTSSLPGGISVASTAAAIEELRLGCSRAQLVLNDAYIHGSRVVLIGSAAKGLIGKKVKIIFGTGSKQVATATVGANGQYSTTAPLPAAKIREALSTRYTAEIGSLRSLHLKLTRRLLLEPPKASTGTVTLSGQVTLPLTKPIAPIVVEQQLECGRTTIADTFTPPANGRFHLTLAVPGAAKAGIYTLKSKVAANPHTTTHGFTTYSLPLPVIIGG